MSELLEDPAFRKMMKTRPRLPANLIRPELGPPWHLWVELANGKWRRGRYATYDDAWRKMNEQIKLPGVSDVSVVSVRYLMGPPPGFRWQSRKYPWCGRCRRPSMFPYILDHRAVDFDEINIDEPFRCMFCGIRQAALPRYSPVR